MSTKKKPKKPEGLKSPVTESQISEGYTSVFVDASPLAGK
jgi:hypothetical protein